MVRGKAARMGGGGVGRDEGCEEKRKNFVEYGQIMFYNGEMCKISFGNSA